MMIKLYYLCVLAIFFMLLLTFLTKLNVILKNCKLGNFIRSPLFSYIVKRFIFSIFALFTVVTIVFLLIHLLPNDYYSPTSVNSISKDYYSQNSNESLISQLFDFYYNILPFPKKVCTSTCLVNGEMICNNYEYKIINLGYSSSYMTNVSVWTIIKDKSSISFYISFIGFLFQCLIGYSLGIYLARKNSKLMNGIVDTLTSTILIIPSIIYFYIFLIIFMVYFKLPVVFDMENPLSYIAPLTSLTLWSCFVIAYWVRKYISLEYRSDYVKLAYSKGFSSKYIFYRHIAKNALIPLLRTIPVSLVLCFSGAYLFESAFSIPGMGLTFISAINLKDVYLIQGLVIFYSSLSIMAYFIGDIMTAILDPRVTLTKEGYDE